MSLELMSGCIAFDTIYTSKNASFLVQNIQTGDLNANVVNAIHS